MHNWTVVVPLLLIALVLGWVLKAINDSAEIRGLRAQNDALEAQRQLALDQNGVSAREISELRAEAVELRKRPTPELFEIVVNKIQVVDSANTATGRLLSTNTVSGDKFHATGTVTSPKKVP